MTETTFISFFAVHQTCRDLDAQVKLYLEYGFVEDEEYQAIEDIPDEYYSARGITKGDLVKTTALRLPADPYMHCILNQFKAPKADAKWPATFDQLGTRGHAFIVKSVSKELERIQRDFSEVRVIQRPLRIKRKWGHTTSALLIDPSHVFFELVEIEPGSAYFRRDLKAPPPTEKSWLHYMLNDEEAEKSETFYKSFGFVHDYRVDFRDEVGFAPYGLEKFAKEHGEAFGAVMSDPPRVNFFRNLNDPSNMHLELLSFGKGILAKPGPTPIWTQFGIARYCFKTPTKAEDLDRSLKCGHRIYIPDNKICVGWGDTEYYYFGDADHNILTSEQWHPYGQWGEKV